MAKKETHVNPTKDYRDKPDLVCANFAYKDLSGASFYKCNLLQADFTGANLERASFYGACIEGCIFTDAKMDDCNLDCAIIGKSHRIGAIHAAVQLSVDNYHLTAIRWTDGEELQFFHGFFSWKTSDMKGFHNYLSMGSLSERRLRERMYHNIWGMIQ